VPGKGPRPEWGQPVAIDGDGCAVAANASDPPKGSAASASTVAPDSPLDRAMLAEAARVDGLRERVEKLEQRLGDFAACGARDFRRCIEDHGKRIAALESRTAPQPDALSEECDRIAAEASQTATPAEPRAGEVWENPDDGERVRLVELLPGEVPWSVEIGGVRTTRYIGFRWRRVTAPDPAALREEVAKLCDAAGWPRSAERLRAGEAIAGFGEARSRQPKTPAEQAALAGLERLAAAQK